MRFARLAPLGAAGIVLLFNGCWLVWPCELDSGSIRGSWTIATVDGAPLPVSGYPVPSTSKRLLGGTMYLTPNTPSCNADGTTSESGTAYVVYQTSVGGGATQTQNYGGTYQQNYKKSSITLSAASESETGGVGFSGSTAATLTFSGNLPDLSGLNVVLRRATP